MALRKNTPAPQFEDMDMDTAVENEATVADNNTEAPTTSAVATRPQSALARPSATSVALQNVMSDAKDAFRVEYDSLPRIAAAQGSFSTKEDEEDLGGWITVKLISYQDSWVCSPNDSKASVELVLYSDDGKFSREGENLQEHLVQLREDGYDKARISHRQVLVGELLATANGEGPIGDLIQVDLSQTGRKSFQTYTLQASYRVAKGTMSAEDAGNLKLTATRAKTSNNEIYTKVVVSNAG